MTPLIISADDFGLAPAIDAAVLDLASRGRVTATACLTGSPHWRQAAAALTPQVRAGLDVGMHLDLTEFGSDRSWQALVASSCLHRLPVGWIEERIVRQLDAFEDALGTRPDYIDGHRHVHQLPQVRTVLLRVLGQRYGTSAPWIRLSRPAAGQGAKGQVMALLGSAGLARQASAAGVACSRRLLGVYGFDLDATAYRERLDGWLRLAVPGDALMVHVATGAIPGDAISAARVIEFAVLASDWCGEAFVRYGIRPVRGNALPVAVRT